jgi:cytochrome c biogenesis protein CcmG, thiol:disulfide interchange protein DsbE
MEDTADATPDDQPSSSDDVDEDEPIRRSPIPWLVGGFLGLLCLFLVVNALLTDQADEPAGEPPPAVSFELLDGGSTSLAAYRGTPTVVNFFASWCAPCIRELPDIEAASQTFAGQVNVVGLSVSDRVEDTRRLLAETGATFTIGLDPDGAIHREITDLGVMPTTAFIAADGTLVSVQAGTISAADLDERIRSELLPTADEESGR